MDGWDTSVMQGEGELDRAYIGEVIDHSWYYVEMGEVFLVNDD